MSLTKVTFSMINSTTVNPADFGAIGDGVANDAAALQAALNATSGTLDLNNGVYLVNSGLTVPATVKRIVNGSIVQGVAGSHVLSVTSSTGLVVSNVTFSGVAGTAFANNNDAIHIVTSSKILVENCYFEDLRGHAVHSLGSDDVTIQNNNIYQICGGVRLTGGQRINIVDNKIRETTEALFSVAIGLDSTNGHSYSYCRNVNITNNIITGYVDTQAILIHGGVFVNVVGNIIRDAILGIDVAAFNNDDLLEDIVIVGNNYAGTTVNKNDYDASNSYGIEISGNTALNTAKRLVVANNVIYIANRSGGTGGDGFSSGAGINVGHVNDAIVEGNLLIDCGRAGISIQNPANFLRIDNNSIQNVVVVDSSSFGIFNGTTATLTNSVIKSNQINTVSIGLRDSSTASVNSFTAENKISNASVTELSTVNVSVVLEGYRESSAETTPSVLNVTTLYVSNNSPTSITNFTNGFQYQKFVLVTDDANTTIVNGATIKTGTGGNVALGTYVSKSFVNISGVWYMQ
jgi:hypothetical protein